MPGKKEEDFKRKNAFSLYDLMATPLHKNPLTGGHKIYDFSIPFLGHHYYTLSMSEPCPE